MSGLEDIPLIGGIAETAIHGVEAVGDAVEGDWDGAAHEAYSMAGSAVHAVADDLTGGIAGAVEGVYDAAAPGLGLPTSDDISHGIEHGLQDLGGDIGDGVYNLVHGGDGIGGGDLGAGLSPDGDPSGGDAADFGQPESDTGEMGDMGGGEEAGY